MKTVYLVRHGESTENVRTDRIFRNHHAELTDTGRSQASAIADRASRLPLEVIISSTMVRAEHTGEAIHRATGVPMEASDLFVERKVPHSFVGQSWDDPDFRKRFDAWEKTFFGSEAFEDGENFDAIAKRGREALSYLDSRTESHILVVTHGFFLRVLTGLVLLQERFGPEDMRKLFTTIKTRNTGITVIVSGTEVEVLANGEQSVPGAWQMLTWNDHAHLG
jgi:broad specificity phosphatase PhoE